MHPTRAVIALLAVAAAACGSARPVTTTTSVAPPPVPVAAADNGWAVAPGAHLKAIADTGDENGAAATRLLVTTLSNGGPRTVYAPGLWQLPMPVAGGAAEGVAWDGSLAVLQAADGTSRFAVVPLQGSGGRRIADLRRQGQFAYDALSPDGATLYLTEYHDATGRAVDQIRSYDLATMSLDAEPVVDKAEGGEAMAGVPVARVTSADGGTVYTVYEGEEHPFLHTLVTGSKISFCTDLPAAGRPDAPGAWHVALHDGRLTAASDRLSRTFVVNVSGDVPTLES
jgi:hypothetical protein